MGCNTHKIATRCPPWRKSIHIRSAKGGQIRKGVERTKCKEIFNKKRPPVPKQHLLDDWKDHALDMGSKNQKLREPEIVSIEDPNYSALISLTELCPSEANMLQYGSPIALLLDRGSSFSLCPRTQSITVHGIPHPQQQTYFLP